MAKDTAYEAITSRTAWYAGAALTKYDAVMLNAAGKYVKADGTRPFAGIVEYGCDAADQVATVVRGIYPGVANAAITAGAYLKCVAGKWAPTATVGDVVLGVALTAATASGETVSVQMLETPFTIPSAG